MQSGSILVPPKVRIFIWNLTYQLLMDVTDPSVKAKLGRHKQDLMRVRNNTWGAFNGIFTFAFGIIRISSSSLVFFGSSRSSIIVYAAVLGLLRPLSLLSGRASLFQSCKWTTRIDLLSLDITISLAFLVFCSNKTYRRMSGLYRLAFDDNLREDALNNNVADYVLRGE